MFVLQQKLYKKQGGGGATQKLIGEAQIVGGAEEGDSLV